MPASTSVEGGLYGDYTSANVQKAPLWAFSRIMDDAIISHGVRMGESRPGIESSRAQSKIAIDIEIANPSVRHHASEVACAIAANASTTANGRHKPAYNIPRIAEATQCASTSFMISMPKLRTRKQPLASVCGDHAIATMNRASPLR